MKNNMITMVLAISAACFGASALNAQSNDLTAKVPFAFQVSGKDFPAGRYIVRANGYSGIPSMQNADSGQSVFVSGATRSLTHAGPARLVFHCYAGNTCFLAEIRLTAYRLRQLRFDV